MDGVDTDTARKAADDSPDLTTVYQGLNSRVRDNFDLQWRGPTFALTAQSFLFAAWANSSRHPVVQMYFGFLVFIVGIVAFVVMQRVQFLIEIDQELLDRYEEEMNVPRHLRLNHTSPPIKRAEETSKSGREPILRTDEVEPKAGWLYKILPNALNSTLWSILLLIIGFFGLGLGLWSLTL
jgi:hypothetical protein